MNPLFSSQKDKTIACTQYSISRDKKLSTKLWYQILDSTSSQKMFYPRKSGTSTGLLRENNFKVDILTLLPWFSGVFFYIRDISGISWQKTTIFKFLRKCATITAHRQQMTSESPRSSTRGINSQGKSKKHFHQNSNDIAKWCHHWYFRLEVIFKRSKIVYNFPDPFSSHCKGKLEQSRCSVGCRNIDFNNASKFSNHLILTFATCLAGIQESRNFRSEKNHNLWKHSLQRSTVTEKELI